MSKLITHALIATVLLTAGFQIAASAQPRNEVVCKQLQFNCS